MGTTFIEDELLKRSSGGILTPMQDGDEIKSPGLEDLIAGIPPILVDWTNNPTDAADITDGDISTFCTTGDKVAGSAYQYAYFEWDLGAFYNVLCNGVGNGTASAGAPTLSVFFWDGSAWLRAADNSCQSTFVRYFDVVGGLASKVRLGLTSSAAATNTPNIREFHIWRL